MSTLTSDETDSAAGSDTAAAAGSAATAPGRTTGTEAQRAPLGARFLTVWFGQTVSVIGSGVSAIGAAVYAYAETGNAVWLGVLTALAALPQVLAAPFMTVVDRFPRRTVMLAGDVLAAVGPATALTLALAGRLEIWHLAVAAFVSELGTAFQSPAAQAAVPGLVAPAALGRANSLAQLGPAVGIVAGPLLAAPLVAWWGITAVLVVDLVSFAVAVGTVAAVRVDEPARPVGVAPAMGWRPVLDWLRGPGRPIATLLAVGSVVNGVLALFNVAVLALATTIGGPERAGLPIAAIGAAMIVGSLVAGARGVGSDRVATFARGLWVVGAGCAIVALRPNLLFVAVGGALAVCLVPAVNATSATIYQELAPAEMLGRLFALRAAIGGALYPAASLVAGVLVAEAAGPLMDGPLAGSLGAVIGSGAERGAALVILVAGALVAAIGAWLLRSPLRPLLRAN